jgi:xylan 1,4-beta-xylosidase
VDRIPRGRPAPARPTPEQYTALERGGQLQLLESPRWTAPVDGRIQVEFDLPLHGVSLIVLAW